MLVPKLVSTLREGYGIRQFTADATAGVIVGIVALPLAIAFGIASGVTPERGLWTAIIAGFLISALGGSRVQIGGPTGAFIVIVYGIVQQHGVDGLLVATFMAGLFLVAFGLARLGGAIKFIPHPVVLGFTTGIALLIFTSQIRDLLGLEMEEVPADFVEKISAYADAIGTIDPATVAIAALALAILIIWPRFTRRIPAPIIALLVATAVTHVAGLDIETVGSRFGQVSSSLPRPSLPGVDLATLQALIGPAFTIAMLAAIESLLSAVVADGMIGGRHRSNMELIGQGIANLASPLFGGIPATGAIARTATNVRNGGRTPIAGIVHAVTLLLITLFFGRWAALIPFAALGAILVIVAWNMSEWHSFVAEFSGAPRSDVIVLLATFLLTVLIDLTVAIQVGMVLAAFLFMRRMAEVTDVSAITRGFSDNGEETLTAVSDVPPGVELYQIDGPFFFGAAEKFRNRVGAAGSRTRVLILRMRLVPAIDSTALHALREFIRSARRANQLVLITGMQPAVRLAAERSGLLDELGRENLCTDITVALERARAFLDRPDSRESARGEPGTLPKDRSAP